MADQQLNIKLNVIDNASKAFTEVKNSIFNLRNALIGIGAGVTIRGILKAGSEAQKLRSQFLQLAPSIDEGKKSFEALQKFIANSPLPSDQIEQSASAIFSLTKNSDKLIDSLTAIQNASIALNIPLETVAREFNNLSINGIEGTRELKRRGLENILGFTDGIKRDSKTAVTEFLKVFGANGQFGLASNAFANTFEGATNRFFNSIKDIKEAIAQAGLLDFFTDLTNAISDIIKDNPEQLKKFVNDFAKSSIEIIKQFLGFADTVIALIKPIFDFTVQAFKDLYSFLKLFPKEIQEIGIVGFLLLGKKGQIAILATSAVFGKIKNLLQDIGIITKNNEENTQDQNENLFNQFRINEKILEKEKERVLNIQKYEEALEKVKGQVEKQLSLFEKIKQLLESLNKDALEKTKELSQVIAEEINKGITNLAEGLAKSIVLGEKLQNVFRSFLQNVLIKILSTVIEILARRSLEIILGQTILEIEKQKINYIKQQNSALQTQLILENGIAGARSAQAQFGGGGGGDFDLGTIFNIGKSIFGFAEGGAVRGGMPITVGERGRELFIPQTNGTIIPNHDISKTGSVININVSAVDVKGVEELFINNRATITNIVNQALNSKGRSNLI
jgi:hypothetical protein